jgi:hypothetical protein
MTRTSAPAPIVAVAPALGPLPPVAVTARPAVPVPAGPRKRQLVAIRLGLRRASAVRSA